MSALEVTPSGGVVGAAVRGVDLSKPIDAATLAEIRAAWLMHSVITLPDQDLTPEDLERFTIALGGFGEDTYLEGMDAHPHIAEVLREAGEKAERFGAPWHTDWSFQAAPPSATMLYGVETPPVGGGTFFASGYAAWDALPEALKVQARASTSRHSAVRSYAPDGFYADEAKEKTRSMKILTNEDARDWRMHPVARVHPETGRTALWVNSVYSIGLENGALEEKERSALLGTLLRWSTKPEFVYLQPQVARQLTMWDNRCVQHRAEGGYDGHRRLMWRVIVAGDEPRDSLAAPAD